MNKKPRIFWALPGLLALGGFSAARSFAGAPPENVIESVSVQGAGKFVKVIVQSARPLRFRDVPEGNTGVVLYFLEPVVCDRPAIERTFSDMVSEIRYGYGKGAPSAGKPEPLEFIQVKFKEPAAYSTTQKEWILAVEIRPAPAGAGTGVVSPNDPVGRPAPLEGGSAKLPGSPLLKDFVQVGLANNQPLKIAEGEFSVANMRALEAMRNMMPAMSLKYSESDGTLFEDPQVSTDDTKFKRKETGVEFGVPIFHSGRNYFGFRSASNQKRVAHHNIRKAKAEATFEITRAYYNLIKAQRAVAVRKESRQRADKIMTMANKKKQLGLITEADHLGAESLSSQGLYRLLSDEKDLEIARLKMAALLNIGEPLPDLLPNPPDAVNPKALVHLVVPPESLIRTAQENRPELKVAEYTALAQSYAYKAAWAENTVKVDGTYFTGQAGGAFESDNLEMRHSWNAALQASLYFGGNTVKGAATQEHTVPDYSETTATDVSGRTASFNLFDSLRSAGDARQARVNRDRAAYERQEALRNVEVDVRESYYNIQKAKIQIKGAQTELDYRDKELAIAQQKERMNLQEPHQTLAAENAYAEAVSGYEEALAFYQTSLASLERAVGVPLSSIPEFR